MRGAQYGNSNRANEGRCSDEEIKDAINAGWTQMEIITKLNTHSQRVNFIRGEMNGQKRIYTRFQQDSFIQNCY